MEPNRLTIRFEPIPDDDPDYRDWSFGRFRIEVVTPSGTTLRTVLDLPWYLTELADWLETNRLELLSRTCPLDSETDESVAARLARYYDELECGEGGESELRAEDEAMLDQLYAYRSTHCLRFGLRGTDAPEVYLGLSAGRYEVSFAGDGEEWRYDIDLEMFLDATKQLRLRYEHSESSTG